MTLSPFEAERREFGKSPFGYKQRDVDQFVDEVQRSLRQLWEDRSDTREENERLKERLTRFEQIEDQLKNTLLLAQDSAEKAHEQARRESELVMREAGQKSRDIVHAAHEDKQRLEMVLRDLHSAEQEARQRLRAMSSAILSHLDDTEQLVNEGYSNFRAVVHAHPEATELRSAHESMSDVAARASLAAEAAVALEQKRVTEGEESAKRVELDAELATRATDKLIEADSEITSRPARMRRTDIDSLETSFAKGEQADAFFDAPPSFDPSEVAERSERPRTRVATEADFE
ncbi:MAG: DivIVA domain-containing protein [Gaiellales bacterium]